MRAWYALALPLLIHVARASDMAVQHKLVPLGAAPAFANGAAAQAPPAGTVDRNALARDRAAAERPPVTATLLARGQERFNIYCAPCHGRDGRGDGMIVRHGFPHPPSYDDPRLIAAPASHFYDVITNGYGAMYPYAARVAETDRWAIIAHIRALQLSQSPKLAERAK
jgi:mono/diheme cytochrome c family protein